jgi:hypothetical protein
MSENTNWAETETQFVDDSKTDVLGSRSVQHGEDKKIKLARQIAVAEAITDRYAKALQELAK